MHENSGRHGIQQVDGCEHWWFEDRGPQCTLLVFVDDATSRLMHLQFVDLDDAFAWKEERTLSRALTL